MTADWKAHSAGDVATLVEPQVEVALTALAKSVNARKPADAGPAAVGMARLALDIELRYRPQVEIDLARFDLWAAMLILDAAADDPGLVRGDFFGLDYVRDRVRGALSPSDATQINALLESLNGAVADEDLEAATDLARELQKLIGGVTVGG